MLEPSSRFEAVTSNGLEIFDMAALKDEPILKPTTVVPRTAFTTIKDLKSPVVDEVEEIAPMSSRFDLDATHIQSSPYPDPLNKLDLRDLSQPLRLFAFALTQWKAIRPDYATAPYMATFNWDEVFEILRELCAEVGIQWKPSEFYVVIFRSQLRTEADRAKLGELDQMSHQEACASGGLLHYWFGSPNAERQNLATCKSSSVRSHQNISSENARKYY